MLNDTDSVPSSHFQVMFISLNVKLDMSCGLVQMVLPVSCLQGSNHVSSPVHPGDLLKGWYFVLPSRIKINYI